MWDSAPSLPGRSSCLNSSPALRVRRLCCCWFCPRERLAVLPLSSQHDVDYLSCKDITIMLTPILSSLFAYTMFLYYLLIVPIIHIRSQHSRQFYGYIELSLVLLSLMAALTSTSVSRAYYQLERNAVRSIAGAHLPAKSMCLQKWTCTFTSVVGLLLLLCYSAVQPIELMCTGELLLGCSEHLIWSGLTFGWSLVWLYIILRAGRLEAFGARDRVVLDAYGRAIVRPSTYVYSSNPQQFGGELSDVSTAVPPPVAIGMPVQSERGEKKTEDGGTTAECSGGEEEGSVGGDEDAYLRDARRQVGS
eukprot:GHVS01025572.1.p1 GENE.GHVS01025572.1~~GHVS01025572.1.p1  ORF type:complete len:305 (+),score=57.56 GHVS01025572.1:134-1048(+)